MKLGLIFKGLATCFLCDFQKEGEEAKKALFTHLHQCHRRLMIHVVEGRGGREELHGARWAPGLFDNVGSHWKKI